MKNLTCTEINQASLFPESVKISRKSVGNQSVSAEDKDKKGFSSSDCPPDLDPALFNRANIFDEEFRVFESLVLKHYAGES